MHLLLHRLARRFRGDHQLGLERPAQKSSPLSPLESLPTELIGIITKDLPLSSRVLLALTSKEMLRKIGSEEFPRLKEGRFPRQDWSYQTMTIPTAAEHELLDFLRILERDIWFQKRYLCYFCQKIHDTRRQYWRDETTCDTPKGKCLEPKEIKRYYHCYDVSYPYIHRAMTHPGLENVAVRADMERQFSLVVTDYGRLATTQHQFTARIVNNSFYLQHQIRYLVPWPKNDEQPLKLPDPFWRPEVCYHLHNVSINKELMESMDSLLAETSASSSFGPQKDFSGRELKLAQCKYCYSEYEMACRSFGPRGFGMQMVIWKDFGQVQSPLDAKWRSHFADLETVDFAAGSIKRIFGGERLHFDEEAERELRFCNGRRLTRPNHSTTL